MHGAGDRSRTDLSLCGAQSCPWTHRLGGAVGSTIFFETPSARAFGVSYVHRVGIEPTFCPGKSRVQPNFCYRCMAPNHCDRTRKRTRSSPTLWNRTRTSRLSTGRADPLRQGAIVPPSGIEPEPLGLQPSAQTNYARVGLRAPPHRRAAQIIIIVLRLSESSARRAHLGPYGERVFSARTSGVGAPGSYSGAPIAIRYLD